MLNHSPHRPSQWLTLQEAADLLGVHQNTLRRWADAGHIKVRRTPGGHRRFQREAVEQLCMEVPAGAAVEAYAQPAEVTASRGSLGRDAANVMDRLFLIGFDHTITPRPVRERVAGRELAASDMHRVLCAALPPCSQAQRTGLAMCGDGVLGAAVLGTCHRTEFYGSSSSPAVAVAVLLDWLAPIAGLQRAEMERAVRIYYGRDVARHLFEVASGMHSVVRGESQILGQIKTSFHEALVSKTTDSLTATLFRLAIESGKKVRTEAPVGVASASLADMAIDMLAGEAGGLAKHTATPPVVVGSGRMAALVVARLHGLGCQRLTVVSRDPQAAKRLPTGGREPMHLRVVDPKQLERELRQAQLVFFCNRSPRPLVGEAELKRILPKKQSGDRHGRMTIVDLAHPPAVALDRPLAGVRLINLAALEHRGASQAHFDTRAHEAAALIDARVTSFERWCRERPAAPLIASAAKQIEHIAAEALQDALANLPEADPPTRAAMHRLAWRIAGRAAHATIVALKQQARGDDSPADGTETCDGRSNTHATIQPTQAT